MMGWTAILVCLACAAVLLHGRTRRSATWRAMCTPLASIIGSGFLVSLPIITQLVGSWSVFVILGLCVLAYFIGGAIRHNIAHVEPLLADGEAGAPIPSIERLSHLALVFAYFVSVAYYLTLFGSFALKSSGVVDPTLVKTIVSVLLAVVGGVGLWRGFAVVQQVEIFAVSANLAVIAGLMAALFAFDLATGTTAWHEATQSGGHFSVADLPAILGLLILVQGFETSRFLGDRYGVGLRIRTMRSAQLVAGGVYVAFFVLVAPLAATVHMHRDVAAIMDMLRPVSALLPALVAVGALASQSSAAVADTLSASELIRDVANGRITPRHTYPLIALVAAVVTWETDVFRLIALASRSFALYYAAQCVVATASAWHRGARRSALGYGALGLVCLAIVAFGASAEAG